MKIKYLIISVIILIAGLVYTGCDSTDNSKEEVEKANQDMIDAQAQFENEWQQFKTAAELKIETNQKQIDNLKAAMKETTAKFKNKYENQILTLEQKNIELKKKMNEYRFDGKEDWENFKSEFNSEVDSVENALNDIFSKKD